MIKLPDPQSCKHCGKRGRVIDTRMAKGYRRRRRQCDTCNWRWNSYETVINPQRLRRRMAPPATPPTHHI